MSVSGIGSSSFDFGAIRERFRSLGNGENLTKEEMEELQSELGESGKGLPSGLQEIVKNFDELDVNDDGLNLEELPEHEGRPLEMRGGPRDKTMDDLLKMKYELEEADQETEDLDQIIDNFDVADTDQDGTVSFEEAQTYAEEHGLTLPRGPKGGHGRPPEGKPPKGSEDESEEDSSSNNIVKTALQSYLDTGSYENLLTSLSMLEVKA